MEEKGITVKKAENFPEWYTQVVLKAKLADYGPVHGTISFMPNSYAIWENLQRIFGKMIKDTNHLNAYFPMFIPESFLKKEAEHFAGITPEVWWVEHEGDNKLAERLAVRPTSETIIYYFMAKWIRSWRDLPLLLNQWCNIARAEIKDTKPFIRNHEFLWQEGHTAHATYEEAEKEVLMILDFYKNLAENYLAIPVIAGKKAPDEKFPGADYTTAIEGLMPDGKVLQCGTSHHLGQNFSKPFGVKFIDKDSKSKYVYTTSWGISTRLIGAIVMTHGDDKGLVLPPKIADIQAVVIPIFYSDGDKGKIVTKARELRSSIEKAGFRVQIDEREGYSPGYKFNEWEMRGVPVRVELGPKDISEGKAVLVRRDTGEKTKVEMDKVASSLNKLMDEIQNNLFKKAKKFLDDNTYVAKNYKEFKEMIGKGFVKVNWCGKEECDLKIKEETQATNRIIPFGDKKKGKCIYCGDNTETIAYFAKAY
jgi:prolyl-tRNA synthetase